MLGPLRGIVKTDDALLSSSVRLGVYYYPRLKAVKTDDALLPSSMRLWVYY